jgi:hypothetical protein
MKLYYQNAEYTETIEIAFGLTDKYSKSVLFHFYWNGNLNEKHFYSILSCYYFNVYKNKHKIILWLENNSPTNYNHEIEKYAEIRYFSLNEEKTKTGFLEDYNYEYEDLPHYADFIRNILLYNYGGVWLDIDCFILRNFDPLFSKFENEICLYQWEYQNYPNNAFYMSLQERSETMKNNIEYIAERCRGWGFQTAGLTYELPLHLTVLPCSWFDAGWLYNPFNINCSTFFDDTSSQYTFDNFFKGSFCFHWHNKWDKPIHENSTISQLIKIIQTDLLEI